MGQNRTRTGNQDRPNRASNMEPAEGSRESAGDSTRNRQDEDLGTSSDRAMFEDRESAEEREQPMTPSQARARMNAGGITNRPLDEENTEQEQLPPRGRSQDSER